jgi:hypothetical protein
MYTSIVLTALAGLVVSRAPTVEVAWSPDYSTARQVVQTEGKPLAVFLGSGESGYEKVCRSGVLSKDAQEALANKYVCVYVDMSTPAGKQLAKAFEISKPAGLVISDSSGAKQTFHHDGALSSKDLTRALSRFADPNLAPRTTVTNVAVAKRTASSQSPRAGRGRANGVRTRRSNYPSGMGAPVMQPSFGYSMGFGGGCPGGNCGGGGCPGGNCGRR